MNREEELRKLFDRIDALESADKSLSIGELKQVFGEHADEFIKFCDGQAGGDADKALSFDEFKAGIMNDAKDLDDHQFKENWITRMEGVVESAEANKNKEPEHQLHYFSVLRSRGESVRMVARASGVTLKEAPIDMISEWETHKAELPEGQQHVPYITKPDGEKMWETVDILKYVAELGKVLTVDDAQAKWAAAANGMPWLAVDLIMNLPLEFQMMKLEMDEAGVKAFIEGYPAMIAPAMKELADALGDKKFLSGDVAGYGDIFIWHSLDNQKGCCFDAVAEAMADADAVEKINQFYNNVKELDGVKEYLAERPQEWGFPGSVANPTKE